MHHANIFGLEKTCFDAVECMKGQMASSRQFGRQKSWICFRSCGRLPVQKLCNPCVPELPHLKLWSEQHVT